jgi:hypothetical protein
VRPEKVPVHHSKGTLVIDRDEQLWFTREELAQRWRMPVKTLAEWASKGIGPRYAKFGRHVRYPLEEVLKWEAEHMIGPAGNVA